MKTNWMYIVTETLPEGFWRAPQTYSNPLPYGDALALLVDLEAETSREDISFELVAVAQPPTRTSYDDQDYTEWQLRHKLAVAEDLGMHDEAAVILSMLR